MSSFFSAEAQKLACYLKETFASGISSSINNRTQPGPGRAGWHGFSQSIPRFDHYCWHCVTDRQPNGMARENGSPLSRMPVCCSDEDTSAHFRTHKSTHIHAYPERKHARTHTSFTNQPAATGARVSKELSVD